MEYYCIVMETVFIASPSAELKVLDLGSTRRIFIKGIAVHRGKRQKVLETIETPLSIPTIESIVRLKGDWWLDEMERKADAGYVQKRLSSLIRRFEPIKGKRVLDVGSGSGSSAFSLVEAGAGFVQGVEPNSDFVALADMRAKDEGFSDQVSFLFQKDTTKLPFEDNRFDIVTFNAVLEHVEPKLRTSLLQEAYRCLKPEGLLVITETPNRAFPYDGHTTLLPLLPWLPFSWAAALASRFSRNSPRGLTKEQYISEGLVGVTYWEIKKALPQAFCMNRVGGDADWKCDLKKANPLVRIILKAAEKILKIFKLPLVSVLPVLDLVFRKP